VSPLKKILRNILLAPVALVLLFEEWGWEPLARAFARLARLPLWAKLEGTIKALPPWAALLVFGVPVITLIPVKLLALYLFAQGHAALGLALIIAAKITGTAIAARLFQLTEPALMRLSWFARIYTPWKRWKDRVLTQVRESALWRVVRRAKARVREHWADSKKP
jgi:energy-coupling factor transporter transmembrane protein EcfT